MFETNYWTIRGKYSTIRRRNLLQLFRNSRTVPLVLYDYCETRVPSQLFALIMQYRGGIILKNK